MSVLVFEVSSFTVGGSVAQLPTSSLIAPSSPPYTPTGEAVEFSLGGEDDAFVVPPDAKPFRVSRGRGR